MSRCEVCTAGEWPNGYFRDGAVLVQEPGPDGKLRWVCKDVMACIRRRRELQAALTKPAPDDSAEGPK